MVNNFMYGEVKASMFTFNGLTQKGRRRHIDLLSTLYGKHRYLCRRVSFPFSEMP
jgi:hypothetical protein